MMKNKKLFLVIALVAVLLMVMVPNVKATSGLPILNVDASGTDTPTNGTNNTLQNNTQTNNPLPTNNTLTPNVTANQSNPNGVSGNTIPQTGVAGDTALFVFIGVCVISAIYAYIRIRNYKNI